MHHDEYDSQTSQSKGLTPAELQHAKTELHNYVKANFGSDKVTVTITIEGNFDKLSESARAELLLKALNAAEVQHSVRVMSTTKGSVVFRIEATTDDVIAILSAFNSGRLREAGVLDVSEARTPLKDISFSQSFHRYNHGITKRQAAKTIESPDSAAFFSGKEETNPKHAAFGLFLKRITADYSALVITDKDSVIHSSFPFSHRDLPLPLGAHPFAALAMFVDRFGLPIRLEGTSSKLRLGETVRFPTGISYSDAVRFLESRTEENNERYELVCLMESGPVLSDLITVQLLFAISKDRYYASLARLGIRFEESPRGRIILKKRKW